MEKNIKIRKFISKIISEQLNQQKDIENNFWKWFGSSKVVENGEPIVVYHGTSSNFNVFKPSKSVGNQGEADQIEGMYFSDNKDGASFFSLSDAEKYLKPVCLS
jgi:hypothetical protein